MGCRVPSTTHTTMLLLRTVLNPLPMWPAAYGDVCPANFGMHRPRKAVLANRSRLCHAR